ncbi:MAG: hypothetical protein ACXVFU_16775, partial [Nocardioidaceae bacterium]
IALVRRAGGATWREAVGAFGLWLALGWCVAQASVRGLVAREGAFLRTPKVRGELGWSDALRGNRFETFAAVVCLTVAGAAFALRPGVGAAVVGSLLVLQGVGYAAAPLNSLAAIRSDLTAEQRTRRRALPSWTRIRPGRTTLVLGPVVGVAGVALGLVVLAAPVGTPLPGAIEKALPHPTSGGTAPATPTAARHRHARTVPTPLTPAAAAAATGPAATRTTMAAVAPGASPTRQAPPSQAATPTQGSHQTPTAQATPTQAAARSQAPRPSSTPSSGRPSTAP